MVFQWIRLRTTKERRSEGRRLRLRLRRRRRARRHRRRPRAERGSHDGRTDADDGERSNFASYLNGLRQDV